MFRLYSGESELLALWRENCLGSQQIASSGSCRCLGGLSVVDALQREGEATFRKEEEKYKKMKEEDWRLFWVSAKSGIRDLLRDRRQRRGTGKGRVG
jgi:hypothetical protein